MLNQGFIAGYIKIKIACISVFERKGKLNIILHIHKTYQRKILPQPVAILYQFRIFINSAGRQDQCDYDEDMRRGGNSVFAFGKILNGPEI